MAHADCNLPTQQAPLRTTPRRQPADEPARGSARGWARPAPPGMFCTPRGSYSASSLLTARRVEQRELSARAAAAEVAEAEARLPQHVRSPDAACNPQSKWSVACSPVHVAAINLVWCLSPQHRASQVLSPDALRLLDPSLDGRGARAMYAAGVRGTDNRGRPLIDRDISVHLPFVSGSWSTQQHRGTV